MKKTKKKKTKKKKKKLNFKDNKFFIFLTFHAYNFFSLLFLVLIILALVGLFIFISGLVFEGTKNSDNVEILLNSSDLDNSDEYQLLNPEDDDYFIQHLEKDSLLSTSHNKRISDTDITSEEDDDNENEKHTETLSIPQLLELSNDENKKCFSISGGEK